MALASLRQPSRPRSRSTNRATRRSRKRSRADMMQETDHHYPVHHDNEGRRKRRKTAHQPPHPPLNYQSKEFSRLLDSDQDSDEDFDMGKDTVEASALEQKKSRSQSQFAAKSKTRQRKPSLIVLKESSPEQSDSNNECNEEYEQHTRSRSRNCKISQRQKKLTQSRRRSISNYEQSGEDEQSNESCSEQLEFDEEPMFDRKNKQCLKKPGTTHSKSRSCSTAYIKRKPRSRIATRSACKPNYIRHPSKNTPISGAGTAIAPKHLTSRFMNVSTSASQPFTGSHPAPHANPNRNRPPPIVMWLVALIALFIIIWVSTEHEILRWI